VWSDFRRRTLETVGGGLENYDRYYNRIYGDFGRGWNAILDKMETTGDLISRKIKNWVETEESLKLIVFLLKCTYGLRAQGTITETNCNMSVVTVIDKITQ
jgi:hypothetical protein